MRICLPGASGFAGSNLARAVAHEWGAEVVAPGHEHVDLTDEVQGVHRARPETPRSQDAGFGYLVASLVDALGTGNRFTIGDGPAINGLATPTLATDAASMTSRALERGATGVPHCCGGEHADRVTLARRAIEVFELDQELLEVSAPPAQVVSGDPVPTDTRLDATFTGRALGVGLPDLSAMLGRLRAEVESSWSLA